MAWKGLERNKLDYILTDILPVEISELFSFLHFYDFLLQKDNKKKIEEELIRIKSEKGKGRFLFKSNWASMPLKYNILKGTDTLREMSVVSPFSALNIYLFLECYQKDILRFFENNHCFSIRYHKKNTELFYKKRVGKSLEYFQKQSFSIKKGAIQQSGIYFKLAPFESINSFTDSKIWRHCNFTYKYCAKIDYKACFDSIYTHTYSWIIKNNIVDRKQNDSPNLFLEIDRILQNINGRSSNGIVVGPEFSRMIAEVLLQQIDKEVKVNLLKHNLTYNKDYVVFRYVDDIFIFSHEQNSLDTIITSFQETCEKYRLRINELKLIKGSTPWTSKNWLKDARTISDMICLWFKKINKTDYMRLPEEERFIVNTDSVSNDRIKDEIAFLIKHNIDDKRTVVSFLLSTLLKNIARKKEGYTLLNPKNPKKGYALIDLAFYIYSFFPSFEQTRKIISIISYLNKELDFKDNQQNKQKLARIMDQYSFSFVVSFHDQCDWLPFLHSYGINLSMHIEEKWLQRAEQLNDPIIWANLLIYSLYNERFKNIVLLKIENTIKHQLSNFILDDEPFNQRETWYILVFHNCPYLTPHTITLIECTIAQMTTAISSNNQPSELLKKIIYDFFEQKDNNGNKLLKSFFDWSNNNTFDERITYRTFQRTMFKQYKKKTSLIYTSLE